VFTAAFAATAALFSAQTPPLIVEVPDSGEIVRIGDFRPSQALGDLQFTDGVAPTRRNAIKVFGRPDGKDPRGCPNKWKKLGLRMVAANFGGGSSCARSTRIQTLTITGAQWQTERGLKIGDSLDRARELYPELKRYRDWLGSNEKVWRYDWVLVLEPSEITGPAGVDRLSAHIRGRKVVSLKVSPYGAGD
jgi:hypothetical protein